MKDEILDERIDSLKQAVTIRRGEMEPGRVTSYSLPDVKAIRVHAGIGLFEKSS